MSNDSILALSFGGGCYDFGLVVVYPSEAISSDKFLIEVGMESTRKSAYVSVELVEGVDDLV